MAMDYSVQILTKQELVAVVTYRTSEETWTEHFLAYNNLFLIVMQ
jgi:hypothetical protein